MAYVFSTLATDMNYTIYAPGGGDIPVKERHINVKGGAGVANDRLITPLGVMTEIPDEDVAVLEAHPVFKLHKQNGYVRIEKKKADPEKIAADMTSRDNSAPLTELHTGPDVKVRE